MDGEVMDTVGTAADTGAAESTETIAVETPAGGPTSGADTLGGVGESQAPAAPETGGEEAAAEGAGEEALPGQPSAAEQKIRQQISELKKANPEAGKQWAKDHYSLAEYQKEFGSVHEARSAKATIDSLGGDDGINDTLAELKDWRNEAEMFANGDRGLIEQLFEENPDATVTAAQNVLGLLMEKGGDHFDNALLPSMDARMDGAGLYEAFGRIGASLNRIMEAVKEGDGQAAHDLLAQLMNPNVDFSYAKVDAWFKHLRQLAQRNGEKKASRPDPERQALERGWEEFEATKARDNDTRIGEGVRKANNTAISKVVEPFFREMKLSGESKKDFIDGLEHRIYKAMENDKTFQRQANNVKTKGDNNATIQFMHAKFNELLPEQFRQLRNVRYPSYKPGKPTLVKPNGAATNGNNSAPAGDSMTLQQARQIGVDFSKTDPQVWIAAMQNPAIRVTLKNGKSVSIRHGA